MGTFIPDTGDLHGAKGAIGNEDVVEGAGLAFFDEVGTVGRLGFDEVGDFVQSVPSRVGADHKRSVMFSSLKSGHCIVLINLPKQEDLWLSHLAFVSFRSLVGSPEVVVDMFLTLTSNRGLLVYFVSGKGGRSWLM